MNSNILISIIIPVYNAEHFIFETLSSCLDQSYSNIEVIIVNDGSTDSSEQVVSQFKDQRIQYYKINNIGVCGARNYGIQKAQGDLIQFLDADDALDKDKLYEQVLLFQEHGDEYIYSARMGQIINRISSKQPEYSLYQKDFSPQDYFETLLNQFGKYLTTGIWLTPAKLIRSIEGWDANVVANNDGEYFMRVILNSKGIKYTKNSIFYYRRDNVLSISKKRNKKTCEGFLNSYISYAKHFLIFFEPKTGKKLAWKALSIYYCSFYGAYSDLSRSCLLEINRIGYSKPHAHGGQTFLKVAKCLGVINALQVWNLKSKIFKRN
ncbi:glycosyltransferase family A protein [Flavobacterium sp. DSR3-2]|uniref:glycosyltransferase family A protein n=1 Tax=Flavobacterium sp. DSR3-2 TaxID=2804634 RepID=UPI003CEB01C1